MYPKKLLLTVLILFAFAGSACSAPSLADLLAASEASAQLSQPAAAAALPQPADGFDAGRAGIPPY